MSHKRIDVTCPGCPKVRNLQQTATNKSGVAFCHECALKARQKKLRPKPVYTFTPTPVDECSEPFAGGWCERKHPCPHHEAAA